eukprot:s1330_g18.t1
MAFTNHNGDSCCGDHTHPLSILLPARPSTAPAVCEGSGPRIGDRCAMAAEEEAQNTEPEDAEYPGEFSRELLAHPDAAPSAFMFPCALKASDLAEDSEAESEEDEDTDAPDGVMSSIYKAKMFSDPEEYEKWKARGWRAVQCCGGALLVLALIFDEMD